MSQRTGIRPYRWLAEYYDEVFSFAPAYLEPARERVLYPLLGKVRSACDLACGTGTTALGFSARGIRTFGVDLSPAMRRAARRNSRLKRLPLTVLHGDMRYFSLPEPVDLVTCEFDALNHVPHRSDLALVAKSVAQALRPGGWFYFDVNNRLAFEKVWRMAWFNEKPGIVCMMHGGSDPENDRAWTDVEWFIREGALWRRHREHVEEVCWTAAEIRAALQEAGFGRTRAWDAASLLTADPLLKPGYRTLWLARRNR